MMRLVLLLLMALSSLLVGTAQCNPPPALIEQVVVNQLGFQEIHTPGSGAPEEIPPSPAVTALLGADVDLNTVTTVRTRYDNGSGADTGPFADPDSRGVPVLG